MNLSISITTLDVVRFYILQLGSDIPFARLWAGLSPLIIGAAIAIWKGGGNSDATSGALLGIGVSVGIFAIGILFLLFYVAMILSRLDENQPIGEIQISITSKSVSIDSEGRHEKFMLSDLTDSGSDDRFIWMQFSDRHCRFIPERAVSDKGLFASARQAFHDIVESP